MASKLTAIRLTDEDRQMVDILRDRYGLGGTTQAIRFSLKMTVAMRVPTRSLEDVPDLMDLNQEGVELVVEGPVTRPSDKPTAGLFPEEKIRISDE